MNLFRTLALAVVAAASAIGSNVERAPATASAKHVTVVVAERNSVNPAASGPACVASLLPCRPESEPSVALRWPVIQAR